MTTLLLRLGWNSSGWRHPTGELLKKEASYVGTHGFGHEDWNFATTDLMNDRVLGYVRYHPSNSRDDLADPVELLFFSKKPGGPRFLVGRYRNARFLDAESREIARSTFAKSKILDKRIEELLALNLPNIETEEQARKNLLTDFSSNISVKPEDIEIFDPPLELTADLVDGRDPRWINRYGAPITLNSSPDVRAKIRQRGKGSNNAAGLSGPQDLDEEAYCRFTVAQMKVIRRMHNLLSNRFRTWLKKIGATEVTAELNSVDVECNIKAETYLFELKTMASQTPRLALRDAIGQILEYSFYPGRTRKNYLAIVLDAEPSQTEIEWISTLNQFAPPIELLWLVGRSLRSASLTKSPLNQLVAV